MKRWLKRFRDFDYRHGFADSLLDSYIATQIQVLREQRGLSQGELATRARLHQSQVSKLEDVNNSSWTIKTLRRLARAFDLVLVVRFEEFAKVLPDADGLERSALERRPFNRDPAFSDVQPDDTTSVSLIGTAATSSTSRLLTFPKARTRSVFPASVQATDATWLATRAGAR
jgi:transcriptional regulator with XRE-family HTH domain